MVVEKNTKVTVYRASHKENGLTYFIDSEGHKKHIPRLSNDVLPLSTPGTYVASIEIVGMRGGRKRREENLPHGVGTAWR